MKSVFRKMSTHVFGTSMTVSNDDLNNYDQQLLNNSIDRCHYNSISGVKTHVQCKSFHATLTSGTFKSHYYIFFLCSKKMSTDLLVSLPVTLLGPDSPAVNHLPPVGRASDAAHVDVGLRHDLLEGALR